MGASVIDHLKCYTTDKDTAKRRKVLEKWFDRLVYMDYVTIKEKKVR